MRTYNEYVVSCCRKNDALAKAVKEKGNKNYAGGDNLTALTLYNQALMFSRYWTN